MMRGTGPGHSRCHEFSFRASESLKSDGASTDGEELLALGAGRARRIVECGKFRDPAASTRDFLRRERRHAAGFLHAAYAEELGKKPGNLRRWRGRFVHRRIGA
jgi:hypothetical protein